MPGFKKIISTALVLSSVAVMAKAEPLPDGAKKAPPQMVANFYAGKSQTWRSCNGGGIYYGGGWQATAYCNDQGPSIGIGTWSVDRNGRICHDLTWYWPDGGGVGSSDKPVTAENCDDIALAPDGMLWARWVKEKNKSDAWWRLNDSDNIDKGNKYKRKFDRLRRKLGV